MGFLGIGVGVAGVPMPNSISVGPAVTSRVRSYLPVGVIAVSPFTNPTLGLGCKLVAEGFDLVGEGSIGGGKGGVGGNQLIKHSLLIGGSSG